MAYIRKSGRGWQAVIRKKNHPHVYKTFFNKGDASRYARESEIKIEKGLFDDMTEAHQTVLRDILARYRDEITPNKKGAKQETYKINKLMRNKIAKYPLARLTPTKIAEFRDLLREHAEPATVNKYLTLISVAITTARNEWGIYLPNNPVDKLKRLREPEFSEVRLGPVEEEKLLEHATRSKKHWLRAIIIVALETGARRGELFKLCRDDVDLNKSTALLRDTKNGTDRKIGLSPKATETLGGLAVSFDGRYFPTQSESFKFYWRQLQKWSGVMHNFHLLRHEWASRMFEKGWDISLVATQGGWRDWKTLKRYTAISPEHLAKKFREQS
jgi:integrase|tara:strand:- start:176 stop:1162 length:987 start_codon:yes stop_codon:yes gene_type:complete